MTMITRAKKAFPGMIVSLMLAVPAVAHADVGRDAVPSPAIPAQGRGTIAKNEARKPQAARRAGIRRVLAAMRPPAPEQGESGSPVWSDKSGDWQQVGRASWYGGPRWNGRMTSTGERYDDRALTAAHATLPLGSRVRVTEPNSGRSVVVVINDRPGTRTRVIDLSRAAAAELGILSQGVATVALSRD
jgi:rare lipoprotein A